MTYQQEIDVKDTIVNIYEIDNFQPDGMKYFLNSWPTCFYPYHKLNKYGAMFVTIKKMLPSSHYLTRDEPLWKNFP